MCTVGLRSGVGPQPSIHAGAVATTPANAICRHVHPLQHCEGRKHPPICTYVPAPLHLSAPFFHPCVFRTGRHRCSLPPSGVTRRPSKSCWRRAPPRRRSHMCDSCVLKGRELVSVHNRQYTLVPLPPPLRMPSVGMCTQSSIAKEENTRLSARMCPPPYTCLPPFFTLAVSGRADAAALRC